MGKYCPSTPWLQPLPFLLSSTAQKSRIVADDSYLPVLIRNRRNWPGKVY